MIWMPLADCYIPTLNYVMVLLCLRKTLQPILVHSLGCEPGSVFARLQQCDWLALQTRLCLCTHKIAVQLARAETARADGPPLQHKQGLTAFQHLKVSVLWQKQDRL